VTWHVKVVRHARHGTTCRCLPERALASRKCAGNALRGVHAERVNDAQRFLVFWRTSGSDEQLGQLEDCPETHLAMPRPANPPCASTKRLAWVCSF
jgi:hypothetical protein